MSLSLRLHRLRTTALPIFLVTVIPYRRSPVFVFRMNAEKKGV
jgi:hypothetical protein